MVMKSNSPPKPWGYDLIKAWIALVLAVSHHSSISHIQLLEHKGRASQRLAIARRQLIWTFLEICNLSDTLAISWLTAHASLCHRTIKEALKGNPPEGLQRITRTYAYLYQALSPAEVEEAAESGLMGQRVHPGKVLSNAFMTQLKIPESC